ncbi:GNAT family N-acetyltransferase [Brucella oryzae]|uniref:GNAT family N-acetyltransferase n=1 Tax=Brucella oryzae TaxID=335286 RepID=UPI001B831FA9|nr:GNAT family N-acetyltransferase [Brucella oryzae]MBR7653318.1 GNAT family N-acetyltransferase [Brucella oryzae]
MRPENLVIRAVETTDAEGLTRLQNMPGFRLGTLRTPFQRLDTTRKWLESLGPESTVIVAIINDKIVGNAGLLRYRGRRNHAADIMMGIDDEHIGKGIGTALISELIDIADNWLDLKRLELTVYVDNAAAIRLYEKFGFVSEGVRKKDAFRAGEFVDSLAMARLNF